MKNKIFGLVAGLLAMAIGTGANAADKWDMATGFSDTNLHTVNIKAFIADVKAATKELDIVLHGNQSLFKTPEIKKAVQSQQVPIGEILIVQFGNEDPIYELSAVPFLAANYGQAEKLWKVSRQAVADRLAKDGVRLLYGMPWPVQGFYSKNPIVSVNSFKGVKFRTYSAVTSRMAEEMGAIPTSVLAGEIPQAFSTGVVAAMYTSPQTGIDSQAWDYTKYFVNVGGNFTMNLIVANERSLRGLKPEVQKALTDAAIKAETRGWKASQDVTDEQIKVLKDKGMNIAEPSPQFLAELQKIGDMLIAEWLKKAGPSGEAIIKAYKAM
jgi:TRAP-type C4-dicarboxylate transport system substrate-binding protein